jgi:hypothetical protein
MTSALLQDVTGFRGEKIVELCLTDYSAFKKPLFRPGFLGDKWPAIDFYVELNGVRGRRPYFFVQSKATRSSFPRTTAQWPSTPGPDSCPNEEHRFAESERGKTDKQVRHILLRIGDALELSPPLSAVHAAVTAASSTAAIISSNSQA